MSARAATGSRRGAFPRVVFFRLRLKKPAPLFFFSSVGSPRVGSETARARRRLLTSTPDPTVFFPRMNRFRGHVHDPRVVSEDGSPSGRPRRSPGPRDVSRLLPRVVSPRERFVGQNGPPVGRVRRPRPDRDVPARARRPRARVPPGREADRGLGAGRSDLPVEPGRRAVGGDDRGATGRRRGPNRRRFTIGGERRRRESVQDARVLRRRRPSARGGRLQIRPRVRRRGQGAAQEVRAEQIEGDGRGHRAAGLESRHRRGADGSSPRGVRLGGRRRSRRATIATHAGRGRGRLRRGGLLRSEGLEEAPPRSV